MLDPTGIMAVVNSFIAIFRAIQSFIAYLREMLETFARFVEGVLAVAMGNLKPAADKLEQSLGNAMPIVIGFLANQVGLQGLGRRIGEMIAGIQERVDRALDWLIDRAVSAGSALLNLGRNVVGAVRNWWSTNTSFTSSAGRNHELYFQGEGTNLRLMMASDNPLALEDVINNRLTDTSRPLNEDQRSALNSALSEKGLLDEYIRNNTQDSGQETENTESIRSEIQRRLEIIKGYLINGDIDVEELSPSNVTYALESGKSGTVKADPLTKIPGNTQGSPAEGSSASPAGWQLASAVNSASYIIGSDGKPEKTSCGRLRLSKPFKRVHLLSHLLHGPAVEWNLVSAIQFVNSNFLSSFEDDMKTKSDEGKVQYFELSVNYYSGNEDLEVLDDDGRLVGTGKKSDYAESFTVIRGEEKQDGSGYNKVTNNYPGTDLPSVDGASLEYTISHYEERIIRDMERWENGEINIENWGMYYSSTIRSTIRDRLGSENMNRLRDVFYNEKDKRSK
jgi:hypothetical protein